MAFLCTRVKDPDTDEYKKLGHCMSYVKVTKELPLTLEASDRSVIHWLITKVTQEHVSPLAGGVPGIYHLNKKSILRVQLKQNSWRSMMQWHWCYGVSCLSSVKGLKSETTLFIKIIKVLCYSGTMDGIQAGRKLDI